MCSGSGVPVSPWDCDREQRATLGARRLPGRAGNELRWSPAPGRGPGLVYHQGLSLAVYQLTTLQLTFIYFLVTFVFLVIKSTD